jgi:VCBS repeat-containing protein
MDSQDELKLLASDGAASDVFGAAVSLSFDGSVAVVGAYQDDDKGSNSGSVYVYAEAANGVTQTKLVPADGAAGDNFGAAVAVAGDGQTILAGARGDDDRGSSAGATYVYDWNGTAWQATKIYAADAQAGDAFGTSVSLATDGDTALVGARLDDDKGSNAGSAYIFERSGATWVGIKLTASDGAAGDNFGSAVSMSGDGLTALVGANLDDDKGTSSGAAYLYRWNGGSWGQTKLVPSDGQAGDQFGFSVALSADGNTALVGAYNDDDKGSNAGSAYIYRWTGESWLATKLTAPDGVAGDQFGHSVSLSADGLTAVVGSRLDDDRGANSGSAYVFRWDGDSWAPEKFTAPDGQAGDGAGFAVSVAGDGDSMLVGANLDDDKGTNSGSAYLVNLAADTLVTVKDSFTTDEDTTLTGSLVADASDSTDTDPPPPSATFALSSDPAGQPAHGLVTVNSDGTYTYTPSPSLQSLGAGQVTTDTFTVVITPTSGAVTQQTVTITIEGLNDVPVITGQVAVTTSEDAAVSGTLQASDIDGDAVGFTLADGADQGSVTVDAAGNYTYAPSAALQSLAAGETATDSFTVTASDGHGGVTSRTVGVTITGSNDGPAAADDAASVAAGSTAVIDVRANDDDIDSDDDASTLTVVAADALTGSASTDGQVVTYDTGAAFEGLAEGETATDTITYTVSDSHGALSTATVTVTVTGANDGPVAADDFAALAEGGSAVIDVRANDDDIDSDDDASTLTVVAADALAASASTDGQVVTYDAGAAFEGLAEGETATDIITYTVSDSHGALSTATVTVTVTGANDGPVAADDAAAVAEGGSAVIDVRANDDDIDSDDDASTLTVIAAEALTGSAGTDGLVVSYDAGPAFDGLALGEIATDLVTYTIADRHGALSTATIAVTVTGTNDGPTAADDSAAVAEGGTVGIAVLANDDDIDSDDDGSTLTVTTASAASGALVGGLGVAGGDLLYTAGAAFDALGAGETVTDIVTYTVADSHGATATAQVTVTVTGVNDGPAFLDGDAAAQVTELADGAVGENSALRTASGSLRFADVDLNDAHIVSVTPQGSGYLGTLATALTDSTGSGAGAVDWMFSASDALFDSLGAGETLTQAYTVTLADGSGATTTRSISIDLVGSNDGPVAVNDSAAVLLDQAKVLDLLANDRDPDRNDTLSIVSVADSSTRGATLVLQDGKVTYFADSDAFDSLRPGQTVVDTFTYTIRDSFGALSTATVSVTVTGASEGLTIVGTRRPDLGLTGSEGNDIIYGRQGGDVVDGRGGADRIYGGQGNDKLYGGAGADEVQGGNGRETLDGGTGNDTLAGGRGDDLIYGGAGNDLLVGGSGRDSLYGGDGNDILIGGHSGDLLSGGAGNDVFVISRDCENDTITDFTIGQDLLQLGDHFDLRRVREVDTNHDRMVDATVLQFAHGGTLTLLGVTGVHDWDPLMA